MMRKLSTLAMPMVTAGALATAVFGLYVSHRAEVVIRNFEVSCEALRTENAELRAEIARLSERPTEIAISVVQTARTGETLAEKAQNYMNVKALDGDTWKGQIGVDPKGHAIFSDPAWSIRAGAMVLKSYERKHGINTIEALVERFSESNHEEYVQFLCKALGLRKDEQFSITARLPELVRAMVRFETGKDLAPECVELLAVR